MKDVDFFIFSFECKFPDRKGEMRTHYEKCFAEIIYQFFFVYVFY